MRTLKRAKIVPSTKQNTKFKPTLETLISIFNNKIKNTSKKGHLIAYRKAKEGSGPYTKTLIPNNQIEDKINEIVNKIINKYIYNTERNIHQTPHLLKNIEKNSPNLYNRILNGIKKSNQSVYKNLLIFLNKLYRTKFLQFGIDINFKEDKDKLKTLIDMQFHLNKALESLKERLKLNEHRNPSLFKIIDKLYELVASAYVVNLLSKQPGNKSLEISRERRPDRAPLRTAAKKNICGFIHTLNGMNTTQQLNYSLNSGGFLKKIVSQLNYNLYPSTYNLVNIKTKQRNLASYLRIEARKRKNNKSSPC